MKLGYFWVASANVPIIIIFLILLYENQALHFRSFFLWRHISMPLTSRSSSQTLALSARRDDSISVISQRYPSSRRSQRSIDIIDTNGVIELRTSVIRYFYNLIDRDSRSMCIVDLFSTIHVGETQYYDYLSKLMESYDVVLYELITDQSNVKTIDDFESNSSTQPFKKQLSREIMVSAQTNQLAQSLGLQTQLLLYNNLSNRPNWFVADLSSQTVKEFEAKNNLQTLFNFIQGALEGRTSSQSVTLKNFFLPDRYFIFTLRLLSWLIPCPELGCLMIDWARMSPVAGGLPKILGPLLESVLAGQSVEAKKIAFAQQLISGLPDDGNWGGIAKSDIETRVKARNSECCRVLSGFLDEFRLASTGKSGETKRVAILYGAYHVKDLSNKLLTMGLQSTPSTSAAGDWIADPPDYITAWRMVVPQSDTTSSQTTENLNDGFTLKLSSLLSRQNLSLALLSIAYLVAGAFDWYLLIRVLTQGFEGFLKVIPLQLVLDQDPSTLSSDEVFVGLYVLLYIQRHWALLNSLSSVGIEWDKGLFDE